MKSFLQAERDSWFNALFLAMDTVNPGENAEQGHVIQMMTFAESTDCFHCGKLLQVITIFFYHEGELNTIKQQTEGSGDKYST